MAKKPFKHTELSTVRCQAKRKSPKCKGFIKMNVLHRKPATTICFRCSAAGQREEARKRRQKMNKQAQAMGIPIDHSK